VSFIREQTSLKKRIQEYNEYQEQKDGARLGITHREVSVNLVNLGLHHEDELSQKLYELHSTCTVLSNVR
jgi:hypothetical protein